MPQHRIALNALALRPGGSGVQTYIRELLRELPGLVDAEIVAIVQRDVADDVPSGVVAEQHPVMGGGRRAITGLRTRRDFELIHGLDVTIPLRGSVPSVATIHDLSVFDATWAVSRVVGAVKRKLAERAIKEADALVAVSPFTAERVRERFGRDATVTALAAPPDCAPASSDEIAAVVERYDLPDRFVLHVGTIEPRKDIALLVAAAQKADVPVVLAGASGSAAAPSDALILGYVPRSDLLALYGAATVVAYPSRYEGFGLPVLEAMACGAPVIATRVASLSEICGDTVAFVPIGDVESLATTLREVVADRERRTEMVRRGIARAAMRRWVDTATETVAVYKTLGVST
jgi:glycosyltransferase involved in cell wall biosynthesis